MLAIDPGFRTGCKTVVLDAQGRLLHNTVIYPDQGQHKTLEAAQTVKQLVEQHQIEAIAIGNGTASRETEAFVRKLGLPASVAVVMVNEVGGIGLLGLGGRPRGVPRSRPHRPRRRLHRPAAHGPAGGAGQDRPQGDRRRPVPARRRRRTPCKKSLDDVVVSCVNAVGVEVNTASRQLLAYVSGLNAAVADNIVRHRDQHGPFKSRRTLLEVPRLGDKTFEQAAGFPARPRRGEPAGRVGRPPRELRDRGPHGQGPGRDGPGPGPRRRPARRRSTSRST